MNQDIRIKEAVAALTEQAMFATSAERFLIFNEIKSEYKELPQPKRCARFLRELLSRVSQPLESYDLIAVRCVNRELSEEEEAEFQAFIRHPDYVSKVLFSSGHCTYSWEIVVKLGLSGLRAKAEQKLLSEKDADKRIFLESIVEIYDAIADYMLRYAVKAREIGNTALAEALTQGATATPQTFYAALQLLWIITMINCAYITENPTLTVGRLDQILYPLYCRDIAEGRLTREQAAELITDYYCKHNLIMGRGEHQVGDETNSTTFKRILNFDAPQYLLLAGTDREGNSAVNELTQLFADCIQPAFKNPVIVVRYFDGMDTMHSDLWFTLTQKSLQSAAMMYYNDTNILAAYQRLGIPQEDAVRYEHFGCNWPTLGDHCAWMQSSPVALQFGTATPEEETLLSKPLRRMHATYSWPHDFMNVLHALEPTDTMEEIYRKFLACMAEFADDKLKRFSTDIRVRQRRPAALLNYTDCFTEHALQNAESFTAAAKYYMGLQSFHMFGTVVDCFTTVDELVFRQKRLSLTELLQAVEANFEGYPEILALCRGVEKYGSGSALSNQWAQRLVRGYS
ncbi:MAG: hypothetical protein IJN42_03370, partial [Clostridia bacterium]|nr:hypothetical protein [Clostridia bacterium]